MGDRSKSEWEVLQRVDNGSTRFLGNEIWQIRHPSYPKEKVDDYSIQLGNDYVQVAGLTDEGLAVLVVQDRVANGPSLEVIAGGIDEEQTPREAALAEFEDESGWVAEELISFGTRVPQTDRIVSRTKGNNGAKRCHMFFAPKLSVGHQNLGPTEKIEPILIPWQVAVFAARTGEVIKEIGLPIEDLGSCLVLIYSDEIVKARHLLK
ncbi:MAG TPA: NUDIX hydrolase [Candidatus Saccharimonadales bacterium]|nr:NUDIX hydrolase [Candidatus Saccharimonadales bacterium]